MGYRHSRDDILAAALEAAMAEGLSQLTFGRLAKRIGVSDRVIVYYFPTKDELIREVLVTLGSRLQAALSGAFTTPAEDHLQLARAAWPHLAHVEVDAVFAIFFEFNGLAAAGREPYRTLATQLVADWSSWLESFFTGTRQRRRVEAETTLALIDGLLLLRQLAGPQAAARAAKRLGIA